MLTGAGKLPRRYRGKLPVPSWFSEETSEAMQRLDLNTNDIVLASWPKSGTHWVYRAIRLLTRDEGTPEPPMVLAEMLPASPSENPLPPRPWNPDGTDSFAALLSRETDPRLIVSHSLPTMLPSFAGGKGKLVVVCRDPRDVVTSNYFFMGKPLDGWSGSMDRFLAPDEATPNAFGGWFEWVNAFEELVAELGPSRCCIVEYEKMHQDLEGSLLRLAQTLGPEAVARLEAGSERIKQKLGFEVMRESGAHCQFLRKGQPGNWREHFIGDDHARMVDAVKARLAPTSVVGVGTWRDEMLS